MIDCCELARLALWVIGGAFVVILSLFIMFFGYSFNLGTRTIKLEKKNGKELHEIEKLNEKVADLENKVSAQQKKLSDHP